MSRRYHVGEYEDYGSGRTRGQGSSGYGVVQVRSSRQAQPPVERQRAPKSSSRSSALASATFGYVNWKLGDSVSSIGQNLKQTGWNLWAKDAILGIAFFVSGVAVKSLGTYMTTSGKDLLRDAIDLSTFKLPPSIPRTRGPRQESKYRGTRDRREESARDGRESRRLIEYVEQPRVEEGRLVRYYGPEGRDPREVRREGYSYSRR